MNEKQTIRNDAFAIRPINRIGIVSIIIGTMSIIINTIRPIQRDAMAPRRRPIDRIIRAAGIIVGGIGITAGLIGSITRKEPIIDRTI